MGHAALVAILLSAAMLAGCLAGPSRTATTAKPPEPVVLSITVWNRMAGTMEVDYYAWAYGSGVPDRGSTRQVQPSVEAKVGKILPGGAIGYVFRIAAYWPDTGKSQGPECEGAFSYPKGGGTVEAVFDFRDGRVATLQVRNRASGAWEPQRCAEDL